MRIRSEAASQLHAGSVVPSTWRRGCPSSDAQRQQGEESALLLSPRTTVPVSAGSFSVKAPGVVVRPDCAARPEQALSVRHAAGSSPSRLPDAVNTGGFSRSDAVSRSVCFGRHAPEPPCHTIARQARTSRDCQPAAWFRQPVQRGRCARAKAAAPLREQSLFSFSSAVPLHPRAYGLDLDGLRHIDGIILQCPQFIVQAVVSVVAMRIA